MEFLLTAIGLVLLIEGIPWFLSPRSVKAVLYRVLLVPDQALRFCGLTAMLGGLLFVYLARG